MMSSSRLEGEDDVSEAEDASSKKLDPSKDRRKVIPIELGMKYMESEAYRTTYGDNLVWKLYRRNHKGQFPPRKTRANCVKKGFIANGNPCPVCRDEYLVVDYRNLKLLKQFISPYTDEVIDAYYTGLCRRQHFNMLVAIEKARDLGYLTFTVPHRVYDYKLYYPDINTVETSYQQYTNQRRSPSVSPPRRGRTLNELEHSMSAYSTSSALASMIGDLRTATVKRPTQQHGLGFHIRGGRELGLGIYISKVETNSNAEKAGLRAGDQIISVNGKSFESITHQEALRILRSFSTLHLTLCATGRVPSTCVLYQTYTWVDRHGRRVSPPDEYEPQFHRSSSTWSLYSIGKSSKLRKVTLSLEEGESLGLMIRGGTEYGLGIYITGVDPESAADRANLQIGDQILEVNEVNFEDITHDEAVRILKHSKHLVMMILDVGKIPFSCTMYDEMHWGVPGVDDDDQSELSTEDGGPYFTTADPEILRMLNEKARLLLTKKEHASMTYYHTEYDRGLMTLDAFVAVLLELLNTTDKFSLLADIREMIPVNDREKFDDLIYSREFEMKKTCQKLGSSMEHLAADRKADRARRNTYAQCYRYADMDKNTGKVLRHTECFDSVQPHRQSFSGTMDHRRKTSAMYDSPRRTLSASTQALFYGGEDPYGDELRTPSEDSGVDLANGLHYGSRDFQWKGRRPHRRCSDQDINQESEDAEWRRGLWSQRRHSSGGEGSVDGTTAVPHCTLAVHPRLPSRHRSFNSPRRRRRNSVVSQPWNLECEDESRVRRSGSVRRDPLPHLLAAPSLPIHISQTAATSKLHNLRRRLSSPLQPPLTLDTRMPRSLPPSPPKPTVVKAALELHQQQDFSKTLLSKATDLPLQQMQVVIRKSKPSLGIAIEGGIDTQYQLPRIINIHPRGAAAEVSGLKAGLVILAVDGQNLKGLSHRAAASRITEAYADRSRREVELIVGEMKKPTLEMRRSSIMPSRDVRRSDSRELDTTGAVTVPRRLQQQQPPLQPPPRPRLA